MWRAPVTLGGGMTMTKGSLSESLAGSKKPHSFHQSYHAASTYLRCWQRGAQGRTARLAKHMSHAESLDLYHVCNTEARAVPLGAHSVQACRSTLMPLSAAPTWAQR